MQTNFKYFLVYFFFLFSLVSFSQKSTDKFVVVLDAGHGGKDPGRPSPFGYKEKNIALEVILKVGSTLEQNKNIKVIYTRKTDVFLELRERAAIANKADADLFVSVHCNAWTKSDVYGAETYVLGLHVNNANFNVAKEENEVIFLEDDHEMHYEGFDPSSPESLIGLTLMQEDYLDQSILLAKYVQDNLVYGLKRKDRGVKQAGFWVLHNTYMPSILVETGFVTNKNEGNYLNSKKGKEDMSGAISTAILKYANNLNKGLETVIESQDNSNNSIVNTDITFKVQIAAGPRKLETKSYNFNGLKGVSVESIGNGYKYFYGETSSYKEIKKKQEEALEKGYSSCFIVAYKNGMPIKVSDAVKTTSN